MGGGDAMNLHYERAQAHTDEYNFKIAKVEGEYDLQVAQKQSEAVIKQAELDYRARMYESESRMYEARKDYDARVHEADTNKMVQMEALRVREKEAILQFKVDWKQAENDATRAEGARITAESKMATAESKQYREESRRMRDENRYGSDGTESYWYG